MSKIADNTEQMPLRTFTEKAYLDYAMYVILDRALPHIGDGLKPVQRRIIYAMSELGLSAQAKYKKSARTVGDVLGKFHPHGDSACYEAMVLMAQPFSYRYPLVDGQGNWGSADDPKSFAAMRYTESRLSPYSAVLLEEVGLGTTNWVNNFDGTLQEPEILPSRLPNLLLNGTTGIAVGMATDVPPHNLSEVVSACIELLDNPKATLSSILKHIQGPDYPTDAEIITPKNEIQEMYSTGYGSVRMRAIYTKERDDIIITGLPHSVSGAKVLEQIAEQMQNKKLPMIADLRDESDHENLTRLVIIPRSNRVDTEELMTHLFATTELERTYRVNMNVIGLDGRPKVKNLLEFLQEWLKFRNDTVRRRLEFRLEKVVARLHVLDGYLIAFLNIDEVINIIRHNDNPKSALMKKFKLSEIQADAILDLKLRNLAKLEEEKIQGEQKELNDERKIIEDTLASATKLKNLIKKELLADEKKYGDVRRSPIVARDIAVAIKQINKGPDEPMTVILSDKGWVRAGKGHDIDPSSLNYKSGDAFRVSVKTSSNDQIAFIDSNGRSYSLTVSSLPSVRGYGEPLTSRLSPASGASFTAAVGGDTNAKVLVLSNAGYGFVAPFAELITKNRKGKSLINLAQNARVVAALPIMPTEDLSKQKLAMVTNDGRLLLIKGSEVPELSKGKGRKLFGISAQEFASQEIYLVSAMWLPAKTKLVVTSSKKQVVLSAKDLEHFNGDPAQRGSKLPKNARDNCVLTIDPPK